MQREGSSPRIQLIEMKIRRMKISDLPALFFLWKKVGLPISNSAREQQEAVTMIKLNPSSCLVAVEEDKVIGSIFGAFNGRRAWIYHLAIDPDYQNMGYGTALLKKVETALKGRKATKILFWVDRLNLKARSFYKKNGFKVLKDKGIIMEKDLWSSF